MLGQNPREESSGMLVTEFCTGQMTLLPNHQHQRMKGLPNTLVPQDKLEAGHNSRRPLDRIRL